MYNIIRESILAPKALIKYHNKKGWFVFLYMLFLALLLSIDMFVILIADQNPTINSETTGCDVVDNRFVCSETPIEDQNFTIYDIPFYFLSDTQDVQDVDLEDLDIAIIVKDDMIYYRFGPSAMTATALGDFDSVDAFYSNMKGSIIAYRVISALIANLFIMTFIVLISTIPFLRFRKEIRYKKIFKLVVFASTPIAILLLITNLLNLNTILFFIVMFIGYRSIFGLQKELYLRSMLRQRQSQHQQKPKEEDIIDQEEDIIDQEEDDE